MATWLEVSHASHDIALLTGPNGGLHHVAWFVEDWGAIRDAADPRQADLRYPRTNVQRTAYNARETTQQLRAYGVPNSTFCL